LSNRSFLFKIVLIGDGGVGKTTLRRRWMGEGFATSYILTVGADFAVKTLNTPYGHEVKFQIWDLGGQPHFKEVRKTFYAGTAGALVVYDVADRKSYNNVFGWIEEMLKHVNKKVPIVLVGNKIDLRDSVPDAITTEEGIKLRKEIIEKYGLEVLFIETSAKTGENVDRAFQGMAKLLLQEVGVIVLKKKKKILVLTSASGQAGITEPFPETGIDPRYVLSEICRILGFNETEWQNDPQKVITKIREIVNKVSEKD